MCKNYTRGVYVGFKMYNAKAKLLILANFIQKFLGLYVYEIL